MVVDAALYFRERDEGGEGTFPRLLLTKQLWRSRRGEIGLRVRVHTPHTHNSPSYSHDTRGGTTDGSKYSTPPPPQTKPLNHPTPIAPSPWYVIKFLLLMRFQPADQELLRDYSRSPRSSSPKPTTLATRQSTAADVRERPTTMPVSG